MKYFSLMLLFFTTSIFSQEIFQAEFWNRDSSYENYSDLNTYKTFNQLIMYDDYNFTWQSEVFEKRNRKKNVVRCFNTNGIWSKKNDTILVQFSETRTMKFKLSSNRKRMIDIEEDPHYSEKSSLRKVKSKKIMVCNS